MRYKKSTARRKTEKKQVLPKTNLLLLADRSYIVFIILFICAFSFFFTIRTNFRPNAPLEAQLYYLNPDAKLYHNIAANMVNGVGFEDTERNQMILPSVGHPLLLSIFCIIGKMTPYQFTYVFLFASAVLLILAVKIYTSSNLFSVIAFVLYALLLNKFRWLCANVESSIMFSNALLILSLALLYKYKFKWIFSIIAAVALSFNILVRPLFLFPLHLLFVILFVIFAVMYFKKMGIKTVRSIFILALTSELIIFAVLGLSYLKYNDSRLVTGTYGAYALYPANNINVPIDRPYNTRAKYPEEFKKMFTLIPDEPEMTWQKRHKLLMSEIFAYMKQYPCRAIKGYFWRLRQFLGIYSGSFSWQKISTLIHPLLTISAIIFLIWRAAFLIKTKKLELVLSAGLVTTLLFFLYIAIHSVFVYAEFRYVAAVVPILIAGVTLLMFEITKQHAMQKQV